jgi:hypothetical protein
LPTPAIMNGPWVRDHRLADSFVNPRLFSATDVLGRDLAHVVMFAAL